MFILQLIWGKKKYYLLSNRLKAFLAYGCSHAMFDKLCLQGIFFMGGYNAKNLNAVSTASSTFIVISIAEVGKEEEERKKLKSSK